ncbi:SHOCT domain-containing protein [Rhizobium sp. LjRoot254]|uniref:SHOCT domain-containing protein n=1 Tax=Rhizobium sp. LjRoot254 TaxID=3342297 RepID=UPI003ECC2F1D
MPSARTLKNLIALAVLSMGLGACSSASRTETVHPVDHRPVQSDRYPDFSKPLDSAMPQMTDEDAARMETQLSALASQRKAGTISEAEYRRRVEELQALARTTE